MSNISSSNICENFMNCYFMISGAKDQKVVRACTIRLLNLISESEYESLLMVISTKRAIGWQITISSRNRNNRINNHG